MTIYYCINLDNYVITKTVTPLSLNSPFPCPPDLGDNTNLILGYEDVPEELRDESDATCKDVTDLTIDFRNVAVCNEQGCRVNYMLLFDQNADLDASTVVSKVCE